MRFGFGLILFFTLALAFCLLPWSGSHAQAVSTINFSASSYSVREGDGQVVVTVARAGDTSGTASVDYATSEGTASRRSDFTPAFGTLRFAAGETSKTFNILITDGFVPESDEIVDLMLFNVTGATLGSPDAAVLHITDNDSAPSNVNPIDDTRDFVRQHYHDFFNRDPDQAGLDFWTNEIESCGTDQQCREVKRINVSAAFFLSVEFQQSGYFVYRLYRFYFSRPSPIWREFMRDTQELGRGVIVDQPGWEDRLTANKRDFIEDWYARHRVVLESQLMNGSSLNNEQYVSALYQKINITPSASERQTLIDGLNAGTETRASVLGKVADNSDFVRREFNSAFVLMQYLGYLRREPDDGGYKFWLDKLNKFNGNFIDAEMVKAFLSSTEYRGRFTSSDALSEVFFKEQNTGFVFKMNDQAQISQARAAVGQTKWLVGTVLKEPIFYNRTWHFHLDPQMIGLADVTIEACQTSVPSVDKNLEAVGGSFVTGNVMCVAAQIQEVPSPR